MSQPKVLLSTVTLLSPPKVVLSNVAAKCHHRDVGVIVWVHFAAIGNEDARSTEAYRNGQQEEKHV